MGRQARREPVPGPEGLQPAGKPARGGPRDDGDTVDIKIIYDSFFLSRDPGCHPHMPLWGLLLRAIPSVAARRRPLDYESGGRREGFDMEHVESSRSSWLCCALPSKRLISPLHNMNLFL